MQACQLIQFKTGGGVGLRRDIGAFIGVLRELLVEEQWTLSLLASRVPYLCLPQLNGEMGSQLLLSSCVVPQSL